MKCIEARRMVTPFVNKELTDRETEQFLRHIEHCSDCMDELDIYFTVYKALNTLDSGTHQEYNFRKMLHEDIRLTKRGIAHRKAFHLCRGIVLALAELLMILSVYTGYQVRRGEIENSIFQRAIYRLNHRRVESLEENRAEGPVGAERETLRETAVKDADADGTDDIETIESEDNMLNSSAAENETKDMEKSSGE